MGNSVKRGGMPDFFYCIEYKDDIAKLELLAKPELIEKFNLIVSFFP